MCGGNKDEEEAAIEGQGEMEEEAKCSRPAKTVLFIFNLLIFLSSGAVLALGIFALVDSPYKFSLTDGNLITFVSIILIIVGGIGFLTAFIGCCGACTENKCLVITYVLILGILLTIILCGVILAFIFRDTLQEQSKDKMVKTLMKYTPGGREGETQEIITAWDSMQNKLKCCGVNNYRDWHNNNTYFRQPTLPGSCCLSFSAQQQASSCQSSSQPPSFNDRYYSGERDGCYYKIIDKFNMYTPAVAGVAAGVALFMAIGLCLGCITCSRL